MSYDDAHSELRTRFNSSWGTRTPIAWPNTRFEPQTNPKIQWVRFTIKDGDARQTTIGASTNNHRYTGVIFIQLFAPLGEGDAKVLQNADEVVRIFTNWSGTNIQCRSAKVETIGSDGTWYQVNVSIPFIRNELR